MGFWLVGGGVAWALRPRPPGAVSSLTSAVLAQGVAVVTLLAAAAGGPVRVAQAPQALAGARVT